MDEIPFKLQLSAKAKSAKSTHKEIPKFTRPSKHAPKEISSRIPAAKAKKIRFLKPDEDPTTGKFTKKAKSRDPRFDKFSGHFNQGLFEASYSFLEENRDQELKELEKALEGNEYSEKADTLHKLFLKKKQEIQRIKDQKREDKVRREMMKKEREQVKEGKKPFFFKKGLIKQMAREEKVSELKAAGEYEEYSRKKRKREISYEKSKLHSFPTKRRSE